jgi:transcriptional regulator with XRE-family HTH domain
MKVSRTFHPAARDAAALLGAQVRAARTARGWTQRDLAERVGTTPFTIGKVERGDPTVGLGVAFDAAVITGVPLFVEDRPRLTHEAARAQQTLALLPQRVRPHQDIDDDF